jgi:hypothetical protein
MLHLYFHVFPFLSGYLSCVSLCSLSVLVEGGKSPAAMGEMSPRRLLVLAAVVVMVIKGERV